jgi:RNA recognition motif-containing protein
MANIYVGNLPYSISEQQLEAEFGQYGTVVSVRIIKDKFTGQSKGFAFVEMSTADEAQQAIAGLNGKEIGGRPLRISEAQPPKTDGERSGGSRGGFGGSRGGSSRGGDFGGRRNRF